MTGQNYLTFFSKENIFLSYSIYMKAKDFDLWTSLLRTGRKTFLSLGDKNKHRYANTVNSDKIEAKECAKEMSSKFSASCRIRFNVLSYHDKEFANCKNKNNTRQSTFNERNGIFFGRNVFPNGKNGIVFVDTIGVSKTKIVFSVLYFINNIMRKDTFLIQNCLNVFLSHGIKSSMDDIAKELGMSKRTLYEMFESKSELIYKCILYTVEEKKRKMEYYLSKEGKNIIEKLFPFLNESIYNDMKVHQQFFHEIKRYYPEIFAKVISTYIDSYQLYIGKIIREGIKQGLVRDNINVDIVQAFFFELVTSHNHNKLDKLCQQYSLAEIFENTILCFIWGISTPQGIKHIEEILKQNYLYKKNKVINVIK
jgi:AcrR family transcriptional regulator